MCLGAFLEEVKKETISTRKEKPKFNVSKMLMFPRVGPFETLCRTISTWDRNNCLDAAFWLNFFPSHLTILTKELVN